MTEPPPEEQARQAAAWIEANFPADVGALQAATDLRRLADEVQKMREQAARRNGPPRPSDVPE